MDVWSSWRHAGKTAVIESSPEEQRMSGHNRWTKIKRKKEAMGATKGALFTKLIREVTVAARNGGGDPPVLTRVVLASGLANQ